MGCWCSSHIDIWEMKEGPFGSLGRNKMGGVLMKREGYGIGCGKQLESIDTC